jgi:ubiquitin-protein ligase
MVNVRQRRLQADYEKMSAVFGRRSHIRILKTLGHPPEKYQLEFLVTGLQQELSSKQLKSHSSFIAEVTLTGGYPRLAPQCRMLTPVFHPNIAPHAICIGDHWAAGESLANMVVRIAEMISYQSYNLKSPLNGEAAKWVEQNMGRLPLDTTDFNAVLSAGEVVGVNEDGSLRAGSVCGNCGKGNEEGRPPLVVCSGGHTACHECLYECPACHKSLCLKCPVVSCSICRRRVCTQCIAKCSTCGQVACSEHGALCHACGKFHCDNCIVPCEVCGKKTCVGHILKVANGDGKKFVCEPCIVAGRDRTSS